jgi:hypothetical protein
MTEPTQEDAKALTVTLPEQVTFPETAILETSTMAIGDFAYVYKYKSLGLKNADDVVYTDLPKRTAPFDLDARRKAAKAAKKSRKKNRSRKR